MTDLYNQHPVSTPQKKPSALSVSELNRQVKRMLEVSYAHTWVTGEISGLSRPRSGHWYFNLKDDKAQIRCAMFKGFNQRLKFTPKEGDLILVQAKVSLYEGRGDYQLIIESMEPAGLGQLQAAFDALKLKLSLEGLFESSHKKAIPTMPAKIAVITSQSGAVIHDIISVTQRRFPALEVILLPVSVQGDNAASEVAHAIAYANQQNVANAIIVGRGGGSLEDLWAFNEEVVARAIYASQLPIISAVGHEVDFTIADLVADYRAPTPSAAAEKITPDQFELMQKVDQFQRQLEFIMAQRILRLSEKITHQQQRLKHPGDALAEKKIRATELTQRLQQSLDYQLRLKHQQFETQKQLFKQLKPQQLLAQYSQQITLLSQRLINSQKKELERQQHRLSLLANTLNTASPLATLSRGYAIIKSTDQKVRTRCADIKAGDKISASLKDGVIHCTVDQSVPELDL
jgi:exodeoxyribonuclease VII large subunit